MGFRRSIRYWSSIHMKLGDNDLYVVTLEPNQQYYYLKLPGWLAKILVRWWELGHISSNIK